MCLNGVFFDRRRYDLTAKIDPGIVGFQKLDEAVVVENVNSHRGKKWAVLSLCVGQAKCGRIDAHCFEIVALWLFLKLDYLASFVCF